MEVPLSPLIPSSSSTHPSIARPAQNNSEWQIHHHAAAAAAIQVTKASADTKTASEKILPALATGTSIIPQVS